MKRNVAKETRTSSVMTRVRPSVKAKLRALAESTQRSESFLAKEAIEAYVELNDWQVALIKERVEEARTGSPGIPREKVRAWVRSWGTKRELPKP